ncbi:hypothetical protein LXA43DRAFT_1104125 [Ganoderma leucocontextum]|nr:hypothetical protein LXA43DRAFT_1104125 [Ganoderma leucocontextum]
MRTGDVGVMEDLLSHLFFRLCGGGNHKYVVEILELEQGLHREWPKELINLKEGEEDWSAIDLVEERTVRDVKASTIPTLHVFDEDMSRQFRMIYRGTSHTSPSKDADVCHLDKHYKQAKVHVYTLGRHITNAADKVKEFVSDGYYTAYTKIIPKWIGH